MAGLLARVIRALDRALPGPRVGGRESPRAYAEWEHRLGRRLLDEYRGWFGSLGGRRVLDAGCGLGGKSVAYAQAGAAVVGVDINHAHARGAVDFARGRGLRLDVLTADATRLPFAAGSFDLVIANDSMEHFADPAAALAELARVTRTGGHVFIFFTPWGSPLASHLYDYIHLPWCHLLLGERLIGELLELTLSERGDPDPAGAAGRLLEGYRTENNRLNVRDYRAIVRAQPGLETVFEQLKPPRFRFLAPLTGIPRLGELLTGTVTALLRKTG